jgi:maleate isomerase
VSTEPPASRSPRRFPRAIEYDEPLDDLAIGVVVPFDFELDWEYWRYLPDGVSLCFTRTPYLRKPVGIALARGVGTPSVVAKATKALSSVKPAVTLYACSSGSFVDGLAGEERLRRCMLDAGARRAVTSAGAMLEALPAVGAERVAVATPYTRALTGKLVDFLEEAGFQVTSSQFLGISTNIAGVSRRTVGELVRDARDPSAEAVFVSCTALRTYGLVAELEQELGCPVLTSNQVSLWAALKAARPELLDPAAPGWVLGGGRPMARSTELLIEAARRSSEVA